MRLRPLGERPAPFRLSEDTLWIPLVVHLIASNNQTFLPFSDVQRQVEILNRDYKSAKIQFYLARRGPNGTPSCGITYHVSSTLADHDWETEEETLKRTTGWDPDSFLNIWVVEQITDDIIGYARPLDDTDGLAGVVILASVFGEGPSKQEPYDEGRTAVHEIGHVFSLYHPFEGGCAGTTPATCAVEGDEVCDTPPQREAIYGCPNSPPNTCQEIPTDQPDPIDNFMGYVDDDCMHRFTAGQISRMRLFLGTYGQVLISAANQQVRGRSQSLPASCAATATLPAPSLSFRLQRKGSLFFLESPDADYYHLALWNLNGQLVRERLEIPFSLEGLPPGLYVLQIHRTEGPVFLRLPWLWE
ncbi:MAG: zinc metalloprotease [Bacteroidia bacterium]|nr:zinc metalloprotease [Bacteroidia bacterium]MDW8089301.1 zinc metalloprotease [Bacteroidia bacterium]